ncbi:MAG: hypothetical protein HC867_01045 [Bacteroidia bacterium]|nr:hypothetical protein [Bacteroidia bacterium]
MDEGLHYFSDLATKYKIKCAVIHYYSSSSLPPIKKEAILFFDEFGKKELIKIKSNTGNFIQEQIIIKSGHIQYMMLDTTQVIKTNRKTKFSLDNIDVSLLNEATRIKYGIQLVGETDYLGQKCSRYVVDYKSQILTGEIVEWNNILLKIILKKDGNIIEETKAYKLEVKPQLSSSIFAVPERIEILDMTELDNN